MLRHGVGRRQGQEVANLLQSFIRPLEQWLDQQVDRRLVRTFFLALVAIVRLRNSRSGLLLSELGAHILSPCQCWDRNEPLYLWACGIIPNAGALPSAADRM